MTTFYTYPDPTPARAETLRGSVHDSPTAPRAGTLRGNDTGKPHDAPRRGASKLLPESGQLSHDLKLVGWKPIFNFRL